MHTYSYTCVACLQVLMVNKVVDPVWKIPFVFQRAERESRGQDAVPAVGAGGAGRQRPAGLRGGLPAGHRARARAAGRLARPLHGAAHVSASLDSLRHLLLFLCAYFDVWQREMGVVDEAGWNKCG